MAVDISAITFFAPIAAFLLVFIVVFAVLYKLELVGENRWVQLFASFLVASIFVSFGGTKDYVLTVVPWVAVLILALFFILLLLGFVGGKDSDFMHKGIGITVVIILALVFLVSAFVVFNDVLFLPGGPIPDGADIESVVFFDWLYSDRVIGALVLIIASAIVTWVLVKTGKK
jgi:hypothetical protein